MRRLANANLVLARPQSYAERLDVREALKTASLHRVSAAALGLCWQHARRKLPPYRGDIAHYGGLVLDALDAEGAKPDEVWEAAGEALALCLQAGPSAEEVEVAVGNSGAPTAGPTSG